MIDPSPDGGTLFQVLVADDSPETRELLFEALSVIGCAVTCVKDGLEALASLQARPYDLLVTDYQMPRLNGLALLKHLHASACGMPSIVMTGQSSPDLIEEAKQAGVTLVLSKPFAVSHLVSLVESIRAHRSAR
jgi:CheY-like chemotaxis protein